MRSMMLTAAVAIVMPGAAVADDAELHTFHCLQGCPVGAPATNDVVVREIYTLSSDDLTKMADWVAYRVTKESIGPSGDREWRADPWLGGDETLTPSAYDGASDTLHIDRGHQAPLASFSGTQWPADTNMLSNITPQSSALNQGPWVRLEDRERELATRLAVPVYVLTGPLYERMMRPLPGGGRLPARTLGLLESRGARRRQGNRIRVRSVGRAQPGPLYGPCYRPPRRAAEQAPALPGR